MSRLGAVCRGCSQHGTFSTEGPLKRSLAETFGTPPLSRNLTDSTLVFRASQHFPGTLQSTWICAASWTSHSQPGGSAQPEVVPASAHLVPLLAHSRTERCFSPHLPRWGTRSKPEEMEGNPGALSWLPQRHRDARGCIPRRALAAVGVHRERAKAEKGPSWEVGTLGPCATACGWGVAWQVPTPRASLPLPQGGVEIPDRPEQNLPDQKDRRREAGGQGAGHPP